jgi:hypothetical protein
MSATRSYSQDAFNQLPFRDKLEILYGVSARDKRDLILESPEALRLVRSFAPESLFFTLKEIGLQDGADLLALASGEQVCALLDLDCWKKDRLDLKTMLDWLEIIVEGGERSLGEFLNSVDLDLLVLFLRRFIRVYRRDDPEEPPELEGPEIFELDEHYQILFHRRDARAPLVRRLLEELYERDYSYFVTVMEEVWWAVDSDLEEACFGVRNARLQDRGFPDFFEAQEIYRPMRPGEMAERSSALGSSFGGSADAEAVPAERSLVTPDETHSFFSEVLNAGFHDESASELRQEMAFLTNRVMVAEGVNYGDRDSVTQAVCLAHDTVNLALEHLSDGDPGRGAAILQHHYLQHLFRVGWGLLLELRKRARQIADSLGVAASASGEIRFLDTPYREALSGFQRPKPRFFCGLDQIGEIRYRTVSRVADLDRARALLEDVARLPALCEQWLGQRLTDVARLRPHDADDFRLSAAILTGFAHFALGRKPILLPVSRDGLEELRSATLDPATGGVRADVRERFLAGVGESRRFLEFCLQRFEEEFLAVSPELPFDPRFVTCLMIELAR